jgi:SAM-dependent methyltransferase
VSTQPTAVASEPQEFPEDYFRRLSEVEERHWWHRGMREISAALLGHRLDAPGLSVLDAGCGTGGFLRWLVGESDCARAAGFDLSEEAVELARLRVPQAELHVASVSAIPFEDAGFDLVALNDVLQHVPEDDVRASLAELRRVLRPGGTLLVRTGGARRARRERADWRAYDRDALLSTLRQAGFECERASYVNVIASLAGATRGNVPHAPTRTSHGIPEPAGDLAVTVGLFLLRLESRALRSPRVRLPYGHTLIAVASVPA